MTREVAAIIKATARHFGMPIEVILDYSNKRRDVVYARHLAVYLAREMTFESYPRLRKHFGYKTHYGALFACRQIAKVRQLENTKADLAAIIKTVSA